MFLQSIRTMASDENLEVDDGFSSAQSVTFWIEAAKQGDEEAAQKLFNRYFELLVVLSRNRVPRKRRVEDEEDAAIEAMYAFLAGASAGKYPNATDRESLWPLLVDITIKNCQKQLRRQSSSKRNDHNNFGESWFLQMENGGGGNGETRDGDCDDGGLGISDFAIDSFCSTGLVELKDVVARTRATLNSSEQQIFDLKLQQRSHREIAKELDLAPRTVDRKVNTILLPRLLAAMM